MKTTIMLGLILAIANLGCGLKANPFVDELRGSPPATTPSVLAARAATVNRIAVTPHGESKPFRAKDGSVTHGPLYFEDPFEDKGSEDGQFAWTGEDYLWLVYWRARFMVNVIAFPVSAVLTPPWQAMVSDGYLSGNDHDAEPRCETR